MSWFRSLRNMLLRLHNAQGAIPAADGSLATLEVFKQAYEQPLTRIISHTGAAMAPTLNAPAATGQPTVERLLMRVLFMPLLRLQRSGILDTRSVFPGDVVAFPSPVPPLDSARENILVRRVAAIEGQELVTDDPEEDSYILPPGCCWVLADNEALAPPHVIDSRSFGPLPASFIHGRILYYGRPNDHGPVQNSAEAAVVDELLLEAELDVDKLTSTTE